MTSTIYIKTSFVGFHRWKDAPNEVEFLRAYHRHVFGVIVHIPVNHHDREIEFFMFKKKLDAFLKKSFEGLSFECSCERIGEIILEAFPVIQRVDVDEDGQCGAITVR